MIFPKCQGVPIRAFEWPSKLDKSYEHKMTMEQNPTVDFYKTPQTQVDFVFLNQGQEGFTFSKLPALFLMLHIRKG